jgi:DNA-binding XRE family transcriptional regulator
MSREQFAHRVGIHPKTMPRIERGESEPRASTRARMAEALEWTAADVALALADEAPDIPSGVYRAPTTGLDMLSMLEQTCRQFRTLELTIMPGLLQTPAYAAAVEGLDPESRGPDEVAHRVAERLARRRALDKQDPLQLLAVLDPRILADDIGGPEVMAEQVAHLRAMSDRPNVSVRLLSSAGRIAASTGPFKLLTGDDAFPFLVVTEDIAGGLSYRGGRSVVGPHHEVWQFIWERGSDALGQVELQQG